jgi:hypothetical protein
MPFGFGRKRDDERGPRDVAPETPAAGLRGGSRSIHFHGITEEWRLRGTMAIKGRLLDALNRREPLDLDEVEWAPVDGSAPFEPAPGIRSVDPYDLIVVFAGPESLMPMTDDERSAHRIHKVSFDVALEVPPARVMGTVQLHPGAEPEGLTDRSSQMFVAVTSPTVWLGGSVLEAGDPSEAALVNRFYLRGVAQVDLATGERHERLPGVPLGGTTWRERSR